MGEERMRKSMTKIWRDKRGNAMILAAAALPLLIGSAGLATDTIQWTLWKRQLQRAADSAAIAGVYDRVAAESATTGTVAAVNKDITFNNHTGMTLEATYPRVTFPADAGTQKNQVRVELAVKRQLSFSSMFMTNPPLIRTIATAATVGSPGEFCVLSLQNNSKTGIQATGNGSLVMDCGFMTNSTSTNAAAGQGSSSITATTLAAAGGIQQSRNWHVGSYQPYSPALEDPYKDLTPDASDFSSCASSPPSLSASGQTITGGGCYSSLSVGSNKSMTLKNGTYIISGGDVNIQGDLTMTNATLVISNKDPASTTVGSLDMNAQAKLNITASDNGKWAGMAIYQDRRAVDDSPTGNITASSPNKINGGSDSSITGVIYFPNQQLTYNGGGNSTAVCMQLVAKRIYWSGNSNTTNITKNCPWYVEPIVTGVRVRLVA
jgi:Flp pilus assembly protein TadG